MAASRHTTKWRSRTSQHDRRKLRHIIISDTWSYSSPVGSLGVWLAANSMDIARLLAEGKGNTLTWKSEARLPAKLNSGERCAEWTAMLVVNPDYVPVFVETTDGPSSNCWNIDPVKNKSRDHCNLILSSCTQHRMRVTLANSTVCVLY